uniref:Folylpolyglutamate synthase n=1 Tax=Caenorhabditis tropicalis TaxID=1561998 RepID=A0A1I7T9A1_9PELO
MMRLLPQTNRVLLPTTSSTACGVNQIRMTSGSVPVSRYEEAVRLLNSLQSNAATIKKLREQREHLQAVNIPQCKKYLESLNISDKDLNSLNIIHVSGTKGKGSTCAYTEAILRNQGLRTGLYTSPHLVHVRERIRINGEPVDEKTFAEEFFHVYEIIQKEHSDNMPAYFKFLTLLAFRIFLKENVQVVFLEVGIGGEYDCTNVVDQPKVCGVTTLDYDHISILGSKLSEIAWHKAGIFKKGVPAIYSSTTPEAEEVLISRAASKSTPLSEAPAISSYAFERQISPGIRGIHQFSNISLALQLVRTWAQKCDFKLPGVSANGLNVPSWMCDAIESCRWPGRSQVINTDRNITYLLDGAHTPKSMEACSEWAADEIVHLKKENVKKILLFQCTADRCPSTLIQYLKPLGISQIVSCPTQLYSSLDKSADSTNLNASRDEQMEKALKCVKSWKESMDHPETVNENQMKVFDCISNAYEFIESQSAAEEILVLVTGSLHLVGGVLNLISSKTH